ITKKGGDMSEFYYSLSKNVAFGAPDKPSKHKEESKNQKSEESQPSKVVSPRAREENHGETSAASKEGSEIVEAKSAPVPRKQEVSNDSPKQESKAESTTTQPTTDHHKRNQDAVAAAKERYLARKKAKYCLGFRMEAADMTRKREMVTFLATNIKHSFASVLHERFSRKKVNFRTLVTNNMDVADVLIPMSSVLEVHARFKILYMDIFLRRKSCFR
nr:hypothetical protein [Tanacetum cinerariifolium]